jgi:hypothetical protein
MSTPSASIREACRWRSWRLPVSGPTSKSVPRMAWRQTWLKLSRRTGQRAAVASKSLAWRSFRQKPARAA